MTKGTPFHVLIVGWSDQVIQKIGNPLADRSAHRFSHLVHPSHTAQNWSVPASNADVHFFYERQEKPLPDADRGLLASLERENVPSIHNMIRGDRVVSKLPYEEGLRYATFLARRLSAVYAQLKPDVVIISFDALHSGLALAVAKHNALPAYSINFSVIPAGMASFCSGITPASRVCIQQRPVSQNRAMAEQALELFEQGKSKAHAYIAPKPASLLGKLARIPRWLRNTHQTIRRGRQSERLRFLENPAQYRVTEAIKFHWRAARGRAASARIECHQEPPDTPYILFGLHMQPESSIDVWAPFFSNQLWVIDLISRSVPPTHKLLVKVHKSDAANYTRQQFEQMRACTGVELVAPFADSRKFLEQSDMVVIIQGTMGLEAALMGKPVICLEDSPNRIFPSVSTLGALRELPDIIRHGLAQPTPTRNEILEAYTRYMADFLPASLNHWQRTVTSEQIDNYVKLFDALRAYLAAREVSRAL